MEVVTQQMEELRGQTEASKPNGNQCSRKLLKFLALSGLLSTFPVGKSPGASMNRRLGNYRGLQQQGRARTRWGSTAQSSRAWAPLCTRVPAPTCRSTPGSLIYICLTALGLEVEVQFVIPVVILKYVYNTPETNKMYINCISVKKKRESEVLVAQLCLTLCDLMDCSRPGSSVHRILQARILERVAIPSSRGSS